MQVRVKLNIKTRALLVGLISKECNHRLGTHIGLRPIKISSMKTAQGCAIGSWISMADALDMTLQWMLKRGVRMANAWEYSLGC